MVMRQTVSHPSEKVRYGFVYTVTGTFLICSDNCVGEEEGWFLALNLCVFKWDLDVRSM